MEDAFVSDQDDGAMDTGDGSISAKLFEILNTLRRVDNYAPISFSDLLTRTGIDLDVHSDLKTALQTNDKVILSDTSIRYKPKYRFRNFREFVKEIEETRKPITSDEILEATQQEAVANEIMEQAIVSGLVITLKSGRSTKDKVFYPRGRRFMTELTGKFTLRQDRNTILVQNGDATEEVNRGDTVLLGMEFLEAVENARPDIAAIYSKRVSLGSSPLAVTSAGYDHKGSLVENLYQNHEPFSTSSLKKSELEAAHKDTQFTY